MIYLCVAARLLWPNNSFTALISAPLFIRCVAMCGALHAGFFSMVVTSLAEKIFFLPHYTHTGDTVSSSLSFTSTYSLSKFEKSFRLSCMYCMAWSMSSLLQVLLFFISFTQHFYLPVARGQPAILSAKTSSACRIPVL